MTEPRRILPVDEIREDGLLIERELSRIPEPFTTRRVEGRDEFYRSIRSGDFDAVVADAQLTDLGAEELLGEVKRAHPGMVVVFFGSGLLREEGVQLLKSGAGDYLIKSATNIKRLPTVLGELIAREADARRRADELVGLRSNLSDTKERLSLIARLNAARTLEDVLDAGLDELVSWEELSLPGALLVTDRVTNTMRPAVNRGFFTEADEAGEAPAPHPDCPEDMNGFLNDVMQGDSSAIPPYTIAFFSNDRTCLAFNLK